VCLCLLVISIGSRKEQKAQLHQNIGLQQPPAGHNVQCTSDAPHIARAVPAEVQHQPVEAITIAAAVVACSPEAKADKELAKSRTEQRLSQMRLVVKNTFFEVLDEDETSDAPCRTRTAPAVFQQPVEATMMAAAVVACY